MTEGRAIVVRDNRRKGEWAEEWACGFLAGIHDDVRIVGRVHNKYWDAAHPNEASFDVEADGLSYEVKGCQMWVACQPGAKRLTRRRPGRWKIDTNAHDAVTPERAARMMYLLCVRHEATMVAAYLVSHARMTNILVKYRRQGRYISLSRVAVGRELRQVHKETKVKL